MGGLLSQLIESYLWEFDGLAGFGVHVPHGNVPSWFGGNLLGLGCTCLMGMYLLGSEGIS